MFKFYNFKTLSSTNDKAKYFADKGQNNLVVIVERQKKGRGRFGRKWSSESGGLYMTILIKEQNLENIKYLTFIAAVSVAKAIKKISKLNSKVKWPNDVLVNDKKICGILTETVSRGEKYALIGIGVNINQKKFSKNIANKATSLKIETNKNYNIKNISRKIIKEFNSLYKYYKNENTRKSKISGTNSVGYNKIINIWKKYSHTLGKNIKVKTISGSYIGKAINIDKDCNLILRLNNGRIKKIVEGDIFVV